MTEHVLFLQGAGSGAYDEDKRLADSLQRALGPRFEVRYPAIPDDGDAPYEQWRQQIERELAGVPGPVVVVGHSVGASVLAKWLSEREDEQAIAGVFLIACPFWGGDGWRYEGYEELELPSGFAAGLPPGMPIYLYHCRDGARDRRRRPPAQRRPVRGGAGHSISALATTERILRSNPSLAGIWAGQRGGIPLPLWTRGIRRSCAGGDETGSVRTPGSGRRTPNSSGSGPENRARGCR
jgi:pimeloyl-ACP methyl ester carboxylesterase